jgi:hypothetical protein
MGECTAEAEGEGGGEGHPRSRIVRWLGGFLLATHFLLRTSAEEPIHPQNSAAGSVGAGNFQAVGAVGVVNGFLLAKHFL